MCISNPYKFIRRQKKMRKISLLLQLKSPYFLGSLLLKLLPLVLNYQTSSTKCLFKKISQTKHIFLQNSEPLLSYDKSTEDEP